MKIVELNNTDFFDYMRTIPDNSVPLIVTDPPYGIKFSGQTSDTKWDCIGLKIGKRLNCSDNEKC